MCLYFIYFSGVHHKKSQCETEKVVKKVEQILEKANAFLYPKSLIVTSQQPKKNVKLHVLLNAGLYVLKRRLAPQIKLIVGQMQVVGRVHVSLIENV